MSSRKRPVAKKAQPPLIQTRISPELFEWLRAKAEGEGFTVALYVRRLLIREREEGSGGPLSVALFATFSLEELRRLRHLCALAEDSNLATKIATRLAEVDEFRARARAKG